MSDLAERTNVIVSDMAERTHVIVSDLAERADVIGWGAIARMVSR